MKFMPSCDISQPEALEGKSVVYLAQNGQGHDHEHAKKHGLEVGKVYTISAVHVESWYSAVYLKEVPVGERGPVGFNSVMFLEEDVYAQLMQV